MGNFSTRLREYPRRNEADFKWAEGEEEPLEVEEFPSDDDEGPEASSEQCAIVCR